MNIERIKEVTSQDNQYLKLARSLVLKKNRLEEGLYIADGLRVVEEVFLHGDVQVCFLSRSRFREIERNEKLIRMINDGCRGEVLLVSDSLFSKIVPTDTPQGIAALCRLPKYIFEDEELNALEFTSPFIPILDGISDPGNCGTIIRLAAGMGFDLAIMTGNSADPYGPKVVRASSGLISKIKILYHRETGAVITRLKERGYKILAADSEGKRPIRGFVFPEKSALVLGGEAAGVSPEAQTAADEVLSIPTIDDVDSYNVATSSAIFFYEYASGKRNPSE